MAKTVYLAFGTMMPRVRTSALRPPMTKLNTRVRDDDLVIFILTNAILFHSFSKLFIIILMKFYIFTFID